MHNLKYSFIALAIFVIPIMSIAEQNAGFVDGIWFSKQSPTDGDTITIFVAVQNQTPSMANGSVSFFDANEEIGTVIFNVAPNNINPVAIQYTLSAGEHPISARIISAENSELTYTTLPVRTIFAKIKPAPNEKEPKNSIKKIIPNLNISEIASSTVIQTLANTADTMAKTGTNVASSIFTKIDPKAKKIAENLRKKSTEFKSSQLKNAIIVSPDNTISGVSTNNPKSTKRDQLAAVGLTAAAFGFDNWLWILTVVGVLMIIFTIYHRRIT